MIHFFTDSAPPFLCHATLHPGDEIVVVVLHRVGSLEYFCPKQGQDFKPSAAPLYPNMGQVLPPPPDPGATVLGEGWSLPPKRVALGKRAGREWTRRWLVLNHKPSFLPLPYPKGTTLLITLLPLKVFTACDIYEHDRSLQWWLFFSVLYFTVWCTFKRHFHGRGRNLRVWTHHFSPDWDANRAVLEVGRLP